MGREDDVNAYRYSADGFKIRLRRRFLPYLLRVYVPCVLFVVISWLSFLIDPAMVPGRLALLVTLLLLLINMHNGVSLGMPMVDGITSIEMWIFASIFFVCGAMLEYAYLVWERH